MTFHIRLKLFSFAFVFALFTLLQRHHPLDPLAVRSVAHTHRYAERAQNLYTHIYIEASSHNCVYTYIVGHDTRDTQSRGCTLRQRCVHTLIWVCRRVETGIL